MKRYRLITALLSLILLACLSGVEGQYMQMGSGGYTSPSPTLVSQTTPQTSQVGQTANQYSQYYTMGPAPNTHITAPSNSIFQKMLQLPFSLVISDNQWLILNINPVPQ